VHEAFDDGYSALGEPFPRILDAARAGGEWAWSELYHAVAPDLLRYLRARGIAEPEDVVGETFLRVVRASGGFEGDGTSFRAWVFTIGRNTAIDAARHRARRPEEPREDLTGLGPTGDVEADALAGLQRTDVRHLLDGLTDDQRDVLLLRFLSDLPFGEIAEMLGKREGTVRMIQNRALTALRGKISEGRVTS
jgi:RNA polymerase sigma-70 factor (ECF subfamily)